jgi:RNA recognition motif-containing protein
MSNTDWTVEETDDFSEDDDVEPEVHLPVEAAKPQPINEIKQQPSSPRPPPPGGRDNNFIIRVKNLSFKCSENDIGMFFESGGCFVYDVELINDRETGKFSGIAKVTFNDRASYAVE